VLRENGAGRHPDNLAADVAALADHVPEPPEFIPQGADPFLTLGRVISCRAAWVVEVVQVAEHGSDGYFAAEMPRSVATFDRCEARQVTVGESR
jgi:hypothetical protein